MKLKNKKTGEIGYTAVLRSKAIVVMDENAIQLGSYTSLAELNSEWEDAPEEPKEYWYIDTYTYETAYLDEGEDEDRDNFNKEIGDYFSSREEAELAVEKLKAWKRLKDKGFRFDGIKEDYTRILQSQKPFRTGKRYLQFNKSEDEEWMKENWEDLDLLFSGGEE